MMPMAQLLTSTIGFVLWWLAMGTVDTRVTMGRGWPFVHLGTWLCVTWIVWQAQPGRRLADATEDPGPTLSIVRSTARDVGKAGLVAAACTLALGIVFTAVGVGGGPLAPWLVALGLSIVCLPMAFAMIFVARRTAARGQGSAPIPHTPPHTFGDVARAMAPLLMLPLVLLMIREADVPHPWSASTSALGRAGILAYAQLPGLWLLSLIVAWGIDRLSGSRSSWAGRATLGGACLALIMLTFALPGWLLEWQSAPKPDSSWPMDVMSSSVNYWKPFRASLRTAEGVSTFLLDIRGLTQGGVVLLLAAGAATAASLARLGRERHKAPIILPMLLAVGITTAGTLVLSPHFGPAAAPWSGVAGLALGAAAASKGRG